MKGYSSNDASNRGKLLRGHRKQTTPRARASRGECALAYGILIAVTCAQVLVLRQFRSFPTESVDCYGRCLPQQQQQQLLLHPVSIIAVAKRQERERERER